MQLRQDLYSAGLIAAEMVEAIAGRVDVLDTRCLGRDVDVIEAEVTVGDEAAIGILHRVERGPAGAGDDEACLVRFDMQVLQDVSVAAEAKRNGRLLDKWPPFADQRFVFSIGRAIAE